MPFPPRERMNSTQTINIGIMEMFVDDRNATVPEVPSLLRAQQSQHWQRRRPWGRRGSDDCPGPSVAAVAAGADLTLAQAQQQAVTAQKKPGSGSLLRVCRVHFFQKGVLKWWEQHTPYNTSTPESALGSKLLRANTAAFALLDIIRLS